jgi:chromosome segregation ATPase
MANAPINDWAWPALIQSLQHDIARLHDAVELLRCDSQSSRDRHEREIGQLVEQLRDVQSQLRPIVSDRANITEAKRDISRRWIERGGWALIVAVAFTVWHYISTHLGEK